MSSCGTMLPTVLFALTFAHPVASSNQPDPTNKVATARWMASHIDWGVLSTTSTRSSGSMLGEAFGNPYSFADAGTGTPYFFASSLDASMNDAFTASKPYPRASFAMSEASLHNATAPATEPACEIGVSFGDPENPPCARLVLSGELSKLRKGSAEDTLARASLFRRHPSFKLYPPGHDFFVAKMQVDGVWLIDFYGGAAIIPPKEYLAPNVMLKVKDFQRKPQPSLMIASPTGIPKPTDKAGTARWLAANTDWGVLSTTSTRTQGTTIGQPFGNPYSFSDGSTGTPYFYASGLDASMIDLFTGNGSAQPNTLASFALSEASLGGSKYSQKQCEIGSGSLSDPETPTCARLVLSGNIVKLAAHGAEDKRARAALFEKHPSFKNYPAGHGFFTAKLVVTSVWLIDFFGGAAIIPPSEYFAARPQYPIRMTV